jgi:hypothetical protein
MSEKVNATNAVCHNNINFAMADVSLDDLKESIEILIRYILSLLILFLKGFSCSFCRSFLA